MLHKQLCRLRILKPVVKGSSSVSHICGKYHHIWQSGKLRSLVAMTVLYEKSIKVHGDKPESYCVKAIDNASFLVMVSHMR